MLCARLSRSAAVTVAAAVVLSGCGSDKPTSAPQAVSAPLPSPSAQLAHPPVVVLPPPPRAPAPMPPSPVAAPTKAKPTLQPWADVRRVDWAGRAYPKACPSGTARPGKVVYLNLDGLGQDEAVVPLACSGGSAVLVFTAGRGQVLEVGTALPGAAGEKVQAVRGDHDGTLLVVSYGWSDVNGRRGEPDIAVSSVWTMRQGKLVRSAQYVDPVSIVDPEGSGNAGPDPTDPNAQIEQAEEHTPHTDGDAPVPMD